MIGTATVPIVDSLPLLTIGRLINLCYFLFYIIFKNAKKHNINIAFHNFKIKFTQNQISVVNVLFQSIIATLSYKIMIN